MRRPRDCSGTAPRKPSAATISLVIPPDRITEEDLIVSALKRWTADRTFRDRARTARWAADPGLAHHLAHQGRRRRASSGPRRSFGTSRSASGWKTDLRRLAAGPLRRPIAARTSSSATLAHELRSPLAPVLNMLEVMKRSEGDTGTHRRARATIERQLGQLVRLVDDLLDLNRITHNRLELRRSDVDLSSVIHQAVEASRPMADAAGHEIRVSLARRADPSARRRGAPRPGVRQSARTTAASTPAPAARSRSPRSVAGTDAVVSRSGTTGSASPRTSWRASSRCSPRSIARWSGRRAGSASD